MRAWGNDFLCCQVVYLRQQFMSHFLDEALMVFHSHFCFFILVCISNIFQELLGISSNFFVLYILTDFLNKILVCRQAF